MENDLQKLFVENSSISESNMWFRIRLTGGVSSPKDSIPAHIPGSPFNPVDGSPFSPCSPYWHQGVSPFDPKSPGEPSPETIHSPHDSWDVSDPEKYPSIFLPENMVVFYSNSSELKQALNSKDKIIINTKHVISVEKVLIDRVCSRRIEDEMRKDFRISIPTEIPQITQSDQELLFPISTENGVGPFRFSLMNQPSDLYVTKDGWVRGFIDSSEWPETGFRDFSILILAEDSSSPKNHAGVEFRYRLNAIGEVSPSIQNVEYQALSERVAEDETDSMPSVFLPEDMVIFYSTSSEFKQALAEQKPGDREKTILNSDNVISIEKVEIERSYEQEIAYEDIKLGSRFSELNSDVPLRLSILQDTLVPSSSKAEVLFQVKATGGIKPYKFTLSNQPADLYITKDGWVRGYVDQKEVPESGYKDYFLVVSVEDSSLPKKTSGIELQYRLHSEDQYEIIPSYNVVQDEEKELPIERTYRAKNLIVNNIEKLRDEHESTLLGKKKTWLKIKLISSASGGGEGSVTSVGLSLPSAEFDISNSPVTGEGVLTAVWKTQVKNTVFAGPGSGSDGVPEFRQLVTDDIPFLPFDKILGMSTVLSCGGKTMPTTTIGLTGLLNVSSIEANLNSQSDFTGEIRPFTIPPLVNYQLQENVYYYVIVVYNNGSPIYEIITDNTIINHADRIAVCNVMWEKYGSINEGHIFCVGKYGLGLINKISHRLIHTERFGYQDGLMLGETGTRNITCGIGTVWYDGEEIYLNAVSTASSHYHLYYHSAPNTWTAELRNSYSNSEYDDNTGGLKATQTNHYVVNWIYRGVTNGDIYVLLGTSSYKLLEAQSSQPPASMPPVISKQAILVGRIIVLKSAATATEIGSAFGKSFTSSGTISHNDTSGLNTGDYIHLSSAQNTEVLGSHAANKVYATPNGTTGVGTFRSIVVGDLPVVTTISSPGSDSNIPTEKAVRSAISSVYTPPGGTVGQLQFNNSGSFGGIAEGNAGQVLTSQGTGLPPVFSPITVSGPIISSNYTMSYNRILGRTSVGTGAIQEISIGANLNFSNGVLSAVRPVTSWGSITGVLSSQDDLQAALNSKPTAALVQTISTPGSANNVPSEEAVRTALNTKPTGTLVTSIATPGSNTNIPTEKAVRDALASMGSAAWGSITGTLSSQTDLQNALNTKPTASLVTSIGSPGLDTNVVSEKAIRTALDTKPTGTKVTVIGFTGSDDNIPTEKAVRDAIGAGGGTGVWGGITGTISTQTDLVNFVNTKPTGTKVTTIGSPGSDDNIPTEQAVREALTAVTPSWGNITGTLSSQTDLQNALNAKVSGTLVTTVGATGSDTNVPTEQAVREGLNEKPTGTKVTVIGFTGSDNNIPTEKAVRDALAGAGVGGVWGSISGTLTDQLDLVSVLNTKPTASLVTSIGSPGLDTNVVSEKAIRTALDTKVTASLVTSIGSPGSNSNVVSEAAIRTALDTKPTGTKVTSIGFTGSDSNIPTEKAVRDAIGAAGAGGVWGSIAGTLTDQLDLVSALNTKPTGTLVTTIASPGSDSNIPTEQAVRELADTKPTATLTLSVGSPGVDTAVPSEKAVRTALNAKPTGTLVTSIGTPGFNSNIPSEKAVRDAITAAAGASWGNISGVLSTQTDLQLALDSKPTAVLVTTVGAVGSDTNVPSEKAVRAAISASGTAIWGNITGVLSNQTDLQSALDTKPTAVLVTTVGATGLDTNVASEKAVRTALNAKPTAALVTTVGSPGLDTNVPSEKAVRDAIAANGAAIWGNITGTLSNQTDLQNALNAKVTGTKVTSIGSPGLDTNIPTEKAVRDAIGAAGGTAAWGSISGTLSNQTDLQNALDAKISGDVTKEPTGFADESAVSITGNADRTITLTQSGGVVYYYYQNQKYTQTSPYTSPSHGTDTNSIYFLTFGTSGTFTWKTTPFDFKTEGQVAVAEYINGAWRYLREVHGLMPWEAHLEAHDRLGTYLKSGGLLTTATYAVTPASPTDADNTPGVDTATIKDEDCNTSIAAWNQGTYTQLWFNAGIATYSDVATLPFRMGTTYPLINGVETSTGKFFNVYAIFVPMALGTDSQKYRVLWFQPQIEYSTLGLATAESFYALSLGNIGNVFAEYAPYIQITYGTNASYSGATGRCRIESVKYLQGTRTSGGGTGASATSPGGTNGQVQYNNNGSFGGIAEGTAGQVLTSGGPGVAPSFTTISSGGSGGGGWGSSSIVTLSTNQTTNLAVGQPIRFDGIQGDHTLSNYRVKIKGGSKAELIAHVRCTVGGTNDFANFQWYDIGASAFIGGITGIRPLYYSGDGSSSMQSAAAIVSPASDTEYELRVQGISGTLTAVVAQTFAQVHSTLPQSNNTASDTYTASDATNVTVSSSNTDICTLTCGNVASGLYTIDGRYFQYSTSNGTTIRLRASSDGGTSWTTVMENGAHLVGQTLEDIRGTYKHNSALGQLVFKLTVLFDTTGSVVLGVAGNDPRFGRKLTAVGPINSPSFGGGWGKSGLISASGNQTTGLSIGSPVVFDTVTGDFPLSNNRVTIRGGSKCKLSATLEIVASSGSAGIIARWYNVTTNLAVGVHLNTNPYVWSADGSHFSNTAIAVENPASDTQYELRITAISSVTSISARATIEATLPTGGAWASSSVLTLAGTQSTGLTAGSPIQFANIVGDHSLSNYGVTVRGGTVAMLRATVRVDNNGSTDIQWYNVTSGQYEGEYSTVLPLSSTATQSNAASVSARVAPSVDSVYQLRIKLVYSGTVNNVFINGTTATVESTLPQPVAGGGWQRSGLLGLSANQTTGLTANSPVLFDTAEGDFSVSSGSVVIKGGTKAELVFTASILCSNANSVDFQWYNVTTSSWVGTVGSYLPVANVNNASYSSSSVAVVNPASDTTYQVRIKSAGGLSTIYTFGTYAKISATALSGGAWAKSSVLKLSTQQTTNLTSGSVIRFDTIEGDHLLSNYRVRVSGGTTAKLTASLSLNTTTEWGVYRWYNYTSGAYVGTGSNVASVTANPNPSKAGQPLAIAIVKPSIDTEYELRFETNYLNQTTAINVDSWATVESTDPMWPSAGGWAKSSLVSYSTSQTTGLTVGSPVLLDTLVGDHTLTSNSILIKGGSVANLSGFVGCHWTSSAGNTSFQFYDVTNGQWVGLSGNSYPFTETFDNYCPISQIWARVSPTVDTLYQIRMSANSGGTPDAIYQARVKVESTDPNPPKGGNWAQSSLVTLSANQTSNLAVGQPIRFDTISGDHTLSNYRVKIKGGQKAELIASVRPTFSSTDGFITYQWYNVNTSTLVGITGVGINVQYAGSYPSTVNALTLETPLVDTEYELRVTGAQSITNIDKLYSYAQVHSTLPNASVTSQVIKKETVAANTTAWTVTLPVSCKAVRVTAYISNASGSGNGITMGVNGVSTGHNQGTASDNGNSVYGAESASPYFGTVGANNSLDIAGTITVGASYTHANILTTFQFATDNLTQASKSFRFDNTSDISSITFTGAQTNGIGAGSYIIVERVDAELSQDLGWQDYTPTCYIDLTSATTVPNITPSVRYRIQGKTLFMQGTLNFTGAPTGATDLAISLPTGVNVVSLAAASKLAYVGNAGFAGVGTYQGRVRLPNSTDNSNRIGFRPQITISSTSGVTPTVPFTWANGHQLEFDFFTEIQ